MNVREEISQIERVLVAERDLNPVMLFRARVGCDRLHDRALQRSGIVRSDHVNRFVPDNRRDDAGDGPCAFRRRAQVRTGSAGQGDQKGAISRSGDVHELER